MATSETDGNVFQITKNIAQTSTYNIQLNHLWENLRDINGHVRTHNRHVTTRRKTVVDYITHRRVRNSIEAIPSHLTIRQLLVDENPILAGLNAEVVATFLMHIPTGWLSNNASHILKDTIENEKKRILVNNRTSKEGVKRLKKWTLDKSKKITEHAAELAKIGVMQPLESKITIDLDHVMDQLIAHPNIERINIWKNDGYNYEGLTFGVSFVGLIMQDSQHPTNDLPIQLPPIYIETTIDSKGTIVNQKIIGEKYNGYDGREVCHPHDLGERFCFGDFESGLALMGAAGDICGYVYILMQFLQQYDSSDPAGQNACRWLFKENAHNSWEEVFSKLPTAEISRIDRDNALLHDIKENGVFQDLTLHENNSYSVMHNDINNIFSENEEEDEDEAEAEAEESEHCPECGDYVADDDSTCNICGNCLLGGCCSCYNDGDDD